jgi:predicted DNA-binding transcriptional regulator YafY
MRRIERLINLIAALLDSERPMTADEIRAEIAGYDSDSIDAFRRAFERDKADLKAMGIPMETREDPSGEPPGYTIPKDRYYLPQLDLEPDELAALRIAADALLGVGEEAESGVMKLAVGAEDAPWSGVRLTWNAEVAAAEPLLASLYQAISDRHSVSFDYRSSAAQVTKRREVEPYGILHRRGHWYLVGRDRAAEDIRTFKVGRIEGTIEGGDPFVAPDDFDVSTHVVGEDTTEIAIVRFSQRIAWWATQAFPEDRVRAAPAGAVDVEMPAASTEALISFVLWWGPDAQILVPPSARAALVERLERQAARSHG